MCLRIVGQAGIDDLHVYGPQRTADGADKARLLRRDRRAAAAFGQSVRLEDVKAKGLQVLTDLGIEARAARDEIPHLGAQRVVRLSEEDLAQVESHRPAHAGEAHKYSEGPLLQATALAHLLHHFFVDKVKELGHAAEKGDAAVAQPAQQFAGVELLEIDHAATRRKRHQQVGHLRQGVEQGKDAQDRVALIHADVVEDGLGFSVEIGVGQHHALGVARRPGGVEQDRDIIGAAGVRLESRGAGGKHGVERREAGGAGIEQGDPDISEPYDCLLGDFKVGRVGEYQAGSAVHEQLLHLGRLERGVERYRHGAPGHDAEVGGDPARAVQSKDGAAVAGLDARLLEPPTHRFGPGAQLREGIALDLSRRARFLQFHGDMVRQTLCGGDKSAVKTLHG